MTLQLPSLFLSVVIFAAFIGFVVAMFMPERTDEDRARLRVVGLAASGITLVLVLIFGVYGQIALAEGGGQITAGEEQHAWLSFSFLGSYHLTADGVSLILLLLSTLLFTCVFFHSWRVRENVKMYVGMLLLLETAVNGVLCSSDYILFLLFWGMQILPLYVLLRVFGGPNRLRAANRYLVFALVSLVLITAAAVLVIVKAQQQSSDMITDYVTLLAPVETAGFWLSFAGFAVAMGVFPVHRWMVEAHSDAAAGVGAIASGILLPLGAYGIMRITLPEFASVSKQFELVFVGLAVVGAVWGTLGALGQDDVRRFIAYLNVVQMSVVMLALGTQTSIALEGAVFLILAHGMSIMMLTFIAGAVQERTRTTSLQRLGGLASLAPRLAGFWLFATFTAIGVPLLAGFVAEFMLFSGAFGVHRIATVLVMASLVLSAGALLWAGHRIFFGPAQEIFARVRDATIAEMSALVPLVAFVLLFGIRPGAVTPVITNGILDITTRLVGG